MSQYDGGTCCLLNDAIVDASCSLEIDLVDGSFGFGSQNNCLSSTSSTAQLLCTSDTVCTKNVADASAKCVFVVFGGGTVLDGVYTGVCR